MGGLDRLWNPCQKRRWRPKVRGSGQEGIENFARKGEPWGIPSLGQDALGSSIEPLVFGALLGRLSRLVLAQLRVLLSHTVFRAHHQRTPCFRRLSWRCWPTGSSPDLVRTRHLTATCWPALTRNVQAVLYHQLATSAIQPVFGWMRGSRMACLCHPSFAGPAQTMDTVTL